MSAIVIITKENQSGWKNKSGTGDIACKCGSWKEHWKNYAITPWPALCSVRSCSEPASDGAHLYRTTDSQKEYIAPLCSSCNNPENKNSITLNIGTKLVPANKSGTCK